MARLIRRFLLVIPLLAVIASDTPSQTRVSPGGSKTPRIRLDLGAPTRMALSPQGVVFVADYRKRRVSALATPNLALKYQIKITGRPLSVAASDGFLYVGNGVTGRIQVHTLAGEALFKLGGADGHFQQPSDMAVDNSRGLLFVVDGLAGLVKVFDVSSQPEGLLVGTIPPGGPDAALLTKPTSIALDPNREQVLISDFGDDSAFIEPSIRIFDYKGASIDSVSGRSGMLARRFTRPQGLMVRGDRIYLVASLLGRVLVIDRNSHSTLGNLGTYGKGDGELSLPLDLEIDPATDDLFVTSYATGKIEIFRDGGAQ